MPLITVLLTSYNHEKYITEAIECVLAQTFTDYELVISDDCSTDNSWQIIQEYVQKDQRIRAVRHSSNQYYHLTQDFIDTFQGKYIAIHHSDDVWEPTKLEKQVKFMETHEEYAACFTLVKFIDENSNHYELPEGHCYKSVFKQNNRTTVEWLRYFLEKGNCLCHPSVLIRRDEYKKHNLCDVYGLIQIPDFLMWVRLLCGNEQIYVFQEELMSFRLRRSNGEINTSGESKETILRSNFEINYIIREYLTLSADLFKQVFPEYADYVIGEWVDFALGQVAKNSNYCPQYKLFGLELLLTSINNKKYNKIIQEKYHYGWYEFKIDTGNIDCFNLSSRIHTETMQLIAKGHDGEIMATINKVVYIANDGNFLFNIPECSLRDVCRLEFFLGDEDVIFYNIRQVKINGMDTEYTIGGQENGNMEFEYLLDKPAMFIDSTFEKVETVIIFGNIIDVQLVNKIRLIKERKKIINKQENRINEQEKIIHEQANTIEKQANMIDEQKQNILNLLNSNSWKVTKSLRKIGKKIKKKRHK